MFSEKDIGEPIVRNILHRIVTKVWYIKKAFHDYKAL
jgi:hypothetical protein